MLASLWLGVMALIYIWYFSGGDWPARLFGPRIGGHALFLPSHDLTDGRSLNFADVSCTKSGGLRDMMMDVFWSGCWLGMYWLGIIDELLCVAWVAAVEKEKERSKLRTLV